MQTMAAMNFVPMTQASQQPQSSSRRQHSSGSNGILRQSSTSGSSGVSNTATYPTAPWPTNPDAWNWGMNMSWGWGNPNMAYYNAFGSLANAAAPTQYR